MHTKPTPTTLSAKPNFIISSTLMPPWLKTMALGGVEMGIIKEKLAQMVMMSITSSLSLSPKKPAVATFTTGKIMAMSAVVDSRLVATMTQQQAMKMNAIKGKSLNSAKNFSKAPPSSACANAAAMQKLAPNKKISS